VANNGSIPSKQIKSSNEGYRQRVEPQNDIKEKKGWVRNKGKEEVEVDMRVRAGTKASERKRTKKKKRIIRQ